MLDCTLPAKLCRLKPAFCCMLATSCSTCMFVPLHTQCAGAHCCWCRSSHLQSKDDHQPCIYGHVANQRHVLRGGLFIDSISSEAAISEAKHLAKPLRGKRCCVTLMVLTLPLQALVEAVYRRPALLMQVHSLHCCYSGEETPAEVTHL